MNKEYADFLRDEKYGDRCVPYTDYTASRKFFIGVVVAVDGVDYFAPISSNKNSSPASFYIIENDRVIATVRMNFMFPVVHGVYKPLDISSLKSTKYRRLVDYEYRFCNKHREKIRALAEFVYRHRAQRNEKIGDCYIVNFKKLEKRSLMWAKKSKPVV